MFLTNSYERFNLFQAVVVKFEIIGVSLTNEMLIDGIHGAEIVIILDQVTVH